MGTKAEDIQKKPNNNEKDEAQKAKTPDNIKGENKKAEKKLTAQVAKKPEKKEKNWNIGIGTTSARGESMSSTTTGIKFENKKKSLEFTVGTTTVTEVGRPGSLPDNKTGLGATLIKRF